MENTEIAKAFDELADLYELDGAVIYRILAYRQAAERIRATSVSVADLADQGRATELQGIGKTLQEKILALLDQGEIPSAVKLKKKWPVGLIRVMEIPGVSAKTARRLHQELGIADVDQLKAAAEAQRIRDLPGFGQKKEQLILEGIKHVAAGEGARVLLSLALPLALELVEGLRNLPAVEAADFAGSARRMTETCHDLDIVAAVADRDAVLKAFANFPQVAQVLASGKEGIKVQTHAGIQVDLRVGEAENYGNLLQHFSGSRAHNIELREAAVKKGLHVSEYGVEDEKSGKLHRFAEEEGVYKLLGYDYIEPELREDKGELEAARSGRLPQLIGYRDIKGNLHCHTNLSDGRNTLQEMVDQAQKLGLKYLAITDHSAGHGFGNAVDEKTLLKQVERIRELDSKLRATKVLAGSEVNILPDGSLDYSDDLLAQLDWVIASVHTSFQIGSKEMTERIVRAAEHPYVDLIGHPSGRMILKRPPYKFDIEQVIATCKSAGTMLEINASPRRRDLSEDHARMAAQAGVKLVINTDAHSTGTLGQTHYGIATARRGWLTKSDVANSRSWAEFKKLRKR